MNNTLAKTKSTIGRWVGRIILILVSFVMFFPLLWNLMVSFKTNKEFMTSPFSLPTMLHFENYERAWNKANMAGFFLNSVYVVALSLAILLLFVIPPAYVLSRHKFFGSKMIMTLYMACIFIQPTYIMVPLFLQLNEFHMLNSLTALSLVYAIMQFPFAIFLLSGFIRALPKDYEEAAQIDGCSSFQTLRHIIVPMAKPGITTVALLAGMGFWNEYPLALTLIQNPKKVPMSVGLANLFAVQRYATDWSALFAALIIVLIPVIIAYVLGQKQLIQGVSLGGIKG